MRHPQEHQLGDGATLIIEYSTVWQSWVGTIEKNGHHAGSILRDTPEQIVEVAEERRI